VTTPVTIPDLSYGRAEEVPVEPDHAMLAFLAERQSGIGGTDAAAIAGLHPYKSLSDVVLEKRGLIPQQEGNERMFWGSALEDPIAKAYATRYGCKLRRVNAALRDNIKPFIMGHPDRMVVGQRKGLEVKTVDGYATKRWSEPDEKVQIPEEYYCQVQWYLGLTTFELWDLAALFGVRAMRVYPLVRNDVVIAALRERSEEVWSRYVIGDELPPMDASDRTMAYLKAKYPKHVTGEIVSANQEQEEWFREWQRHGELERASSEARATFRAHLVGAIGSAEVMSGDGWTLTYRANKDTNESTTDWEAILREVVDENNLQLDASRITRHTTSRLIPGPRVLREKKGAR
jgi:putative phage-type endonuclease